MHVYVPPAPRPVVTGVADAIRLVDGLAWLADDDEVVVVVLDSGRQLLAVVACGTASSQVLGGDSRPVVLPAIALGATTITVVALGATDEDSLRRARPTIQESAERAEVVVDGVVVHSRPGAAPVGSAQTSRSRASP